MITDLMKAGKSELKLSTVAGGGAAVPLLLDLLKEGQGMGESMKIALIAAVTLIVISYNFSRGLSKKEVRGDSTLPPSPPTHPVSASAPVLHPHSPPPSQPTAPSSV